MSEIPLPPRFVPVYYTSGHVGQRLLRVVRSRNWRGWSTLCGLWITKTSGIESRDAPSCKTCVRVARVRGIQVHRPVEPSEERFAEVVARWAEFFRAWPPELARLVLVQAFRELAKGDDTR